MSIHKPIAQRRRRRQAGNSLIEAAFFFPTIIYMCFGVLDYSRLFALQIRLSSAARSGAEVVMYSGNISKYTGSTVASADSQAVIDAAQTDAGSLTITTTVTRYFTCANADGTDGALGTNASLTCTNGTPRIYVQVATSAPSNSVAHLPEFLYPDTVYGLAEPRVQ